MSAHPFRSWRVPAFGLALVLAASLQGCFILDIGSRAAVPQPREIMAPAVGVERTGAADKIRRLDPDGQLSRHGPRLIV